MNEKKTQKNHNQSNDLKIREAIDKFEISSLDFFIGGV